MSGSRQIFVKLETENTSNDVQVTFNAVFKATRLAWDPWWTIVNEKDLPLVSNWEVVVKGTTLNPWVENNVS
ncbi:thiol-activated cytolysin C-terminal domain-containing protein [Arcanobacterium ihumii]|uniref:thiol-activated cytolysin C-terminal domain-containing protein n=1 Tax=Arcanobacterium ihumii TaxID=2138162 RepID=UPI000F52B019|nr:thiol-activated cytolysin C-terminal domain-containing protein [Arcanobacterium ihumii]